MHFLWAPTPLTRVYQPVHSFVSTICLYIYLCSGNQRIHCVHVVADGKWLNIERKQTDKMCVKHMLGALHCVDLIACTQFAHNFHTHQQICRNHILGCDLLIKFEYFITWRVDHASILLRGSHQHSSDVRLSHPLSSNTVNLKLNFWLKDFEQCPQSYQRVHK